jgi:hypothetical protein
MAGILANSATVTMTVGTADGTCAGFVSAEQITLGTSPTGSGYVWGLARPSDSAVALNSLTAAAPTLTPDVGGYYTVTCTVDSATSYVLRLSVAAPATVATITALRFLPTTNASVAAPATGVKVYYSSTCAALVQVDTAGTITAL